MDIIPGIYAVENWAYNVIGVSRDPDTAEACVFCQQMTREKAKFFLVPLGDFESGMGRDQTMVERYDAPRLLECLSYDGTPGLYGHFRRKGPDYNVISPALNIKAGRRFVVYQPLYGELRHQLCHRPEEIFGEHIERPECNHSGPRFFLIARYASPRIAAEYQD